MFLSYQSKTENLLFSLLDSDTYQQALENPDLFGGDMLVPHDDYIKLGRLCLKNCLLSQNAIADENYRWPDGKVPYVIESSLS
ncbi:hypothetical protein CEXT_284461 [Caerostris extrusa]|uniref:Peptidase M12A domain-containing protein n=1 Tax=Caerostris extrusa TaxID=172846 RepID=A0AAV4RI35_CAEEX|nr:hypothetical protein CEXT_284461 [Caerostris extrusa]